MWQSTHASGCIDMISDLTRKQFQKFRSIKRAWYSLVILTGLFILSLFSEQIANNKPILLSYEGNLYFPTLKFYNGQTFGGEFRTEADYQALSKSDRFTEKGNWMLFPVIPYDPLSSDWEAEGPPPHAPSTRHWLGTDSSARDVLARILYGFRIGMLFALALTGASLLIGIVIGALQGYAGGKVDLTGQRLVEIWSALPFLYVVIFVASVYGQSFTILLLVFAVFRWIGMSYFVRAEFLKLKNQTFVQAALAQGSSHIRIIWRHILPNALTPVITLLPFSLITAITALTALDFLGFGLEPPTPSWGDLLRQGLENLYAPWLSISSVGALFITLLLASFIGEGARAAFDPRNSDQ
jgi:microcin C transport system permease protein